MGAEASPPDFQLGPISKSNGSVGLCKPLDNPHKCRGGDRVQTQKMILMIRPAGVNIPPQLNGRHACLGGLEGARSLFEHHQRFFRDKLGGCKFGDNTQLGVVPFGVISAVRFCEGVGGKRGA